MSRSNPRSLVSRYCSPIRLFTLQMKATHAGRIELNCGPSCLQSCGDPDHPSNVPPTGNWSAAAGRSEAELMAVSLARARMPRGFSSCTAPTGLTRSRLLPIRRSYSIAPGPVDSRTISPFRFRGPREALGGSGWRAAVARRQREIARDSFLREVPLRESCFFLLVNASAARRRPSGLTKLFRCGWACLDAARSILERLRRSYASTCPGSTNTKRIFLIRVHSSSFAGHTMRSESHYSIHREQPSRRITSSQQQPTPHRRPPAPAVKSTCTCDR